MNETELTRSCRRGSRGKDVRRIQEWLSLRGLGLVVDGDYGPATEFATREFQESSGLPVTGEVDPDTFAVLARPMRDAVGNGTPRGELGRRIVYFAERHLSQQPREIGGANMGTWVRLYMRGNEGRDWPWCAGFACFVLRQACDSLGVATPIAPSVSCDSLTASAKERERFLRGTASNRDKVNPGDFFLVRRTATDWTHVGIVVKADGEVLLAIEGNTNDAGDREGYEVCRRIRGYESKDFISMS